MGLWRGSSETTSLPSEAVCGSQLASVAAAPSECSVQTLPFNNGDLTSRQCFVALYGKNTCAGYKTATGKVFCQARHFACDIILNPKQRWLMCECLGPQRQYDTKDSHSTQMNPL